MKKTRKRLTPRTARTPRDLCGLPRETVDTKHFWMLVGTGRVVIAEQTSGNAAKSCVHIPKRVFNKFVDFYNGVPAKRRKKAGRKVTA